MWEEVGEKGRWSGSCTVGRRGPEDGGESEEQADPRDLYCHLGPCDILAGAVAESHVWIHGWGPC